MTPPEMADLEAALEASRRSGREAEDALASARAELAAIRGSRSFRLAERVRSLAVAALPPGTRRRRAVQRATGRRSSPAAVAAQAKSAGEQAGAPHRAALGRMAEPPRFTVVVVGEHEEAVRRTRQSLERQTWPLWSVSVVGAGKELPRRVGAIAADLLPETPMVLLGAGDSLDPGCLYEVAVALYRDPLLDVVSWDDVRVFDGRRQVRCRPSWSPETLLTSPYLGTAVCLRVRLLTASAGWPARTAAGLVWAAALRADAGEERATSIGIALSETGSAGPDIDEALAIVGHHLAGSADASARDTGHCAVQLTWRRPDLCSVSLVLTGDNRPALERLWERVSGAAASCEVLAVGPPELAESLGSACRGVESGTGASLAERRRLGTAQSGGDVIVFVDASVLPPMGTGWVDQLAALASRPGVGCAGPVVVDDSDRVVEAGLVVGMGRLAGRRLAGLSISDAFDGPVVAAGAAACAAGGVSDVSGLGAGCLAVRRALLEVAAPLGAGGDDAFGLVLATRLRRLGHRCVVTGGVRAIRSGPPREPSSGVLDEEAALYWVVQDELFRGDPYWSPRLSLLCPRPQLRDPDETPIRARLEQILLRPFAASEQRMDAAEAYELARTCRAAQRLLAAVRGSQQRRREGSPITVTWFIPGIETPFYGGINTALRMADLLAREHGVRPRFACWHGGPAVFTRSALATAFPSLAGAELFIHDGSPEQLAALPPSDAGVATLWITAYQLSGLSQIDRKYYLVQDFEPTFYPAGTMYALAEETYRLGLHGICNTEHLAEIYRHDYGGTALGFTPAVDTSVFHAEGRPKRRPDDPFTVFVYARPGHWRNCWELASTALRELKQRHGSRLRLVSAGAWRPGTGPDEELFLRPFGLLDYASTADLYRRCDAGLALTVSRHPSYLPLELMACGTPVIAFDNIHARWLLKDGDNARLCELNAAGIVEAIEELMGDADLRERLRRGGLETIASGHADWNLALSGIHDFLVNPAGTSDAPSARRRRRAPAP
jgi:glycosyltransferase involved in cell wall biosynthesis